MNLKTMNLKNKHQHMSYLIWIDLEMTGLDEKVCSILQVAMVITDIKLNEVANIDIAIWQPESVIANMAPVVKIMHTNNGLLKQVRASNVSLLEAEKKLMNILNKHVTYQKGYLSGNSIYVDRRFLRKYMPTFEGYLHYRQLDISAIKILCQEWYNAKIPAKESAHTALEDVRQSIEELKYLKMCYFKIP